MNEKGWRQKSVGDRTFDMALRILLAIFVIIVVYPLYFVVLASVSDPLLVSKGQVLLWPKEMSLFGFQKVFEDTRIWIGLRNTVIYTVLGTIINMAATLPAAYALSRKDMRGRKSVMMFFVFTMFFNGGLVPTYLLMQKLHLVNTIWVFILPFAVNVYNLIIARTFFENSIPTELYESAALDGCSDFKFFVSMVMPLSKAVVSVIMLYYMVAHWNDFFTGLIYIRDQKLNPLQLVLREILIANNVFAAGGTGGSLSSYDQMYADTVKYAIIIISSLPMLIIYPFIQKYFEKGVMIGAIKG